MPGGVKVFQELIYQSQIGLGVAIVRSNGKTHTMNYELHLPGYVAKLSKDGWIEEKCSPSEIAMLSGVTSRYDQRHEPFQQLRIAAS